MKPQPRIPMETDSELFKRHSFVLALCVVAFLLNFLFPCFLSFTRPTNPSGILVYATSGVIMAQLVSVGFFFALFPVGFVVRFCSSIGLTSLFLVGLLFGCLIFGTQELNGLSSSVGVLPSLVLAFATSFALARNFLGWRIQFSGYGQATEEDAMSIKSIFLATALVAMAVAVLNTGTRQQLPAHVAAVFLCAGVGLIFLPLAFHILRSRRSWAWVAGAALVSFWVGMGIGWLVGWAQGMRIGFWQKAGLASILPGLVIFFGLFLLALKKSGARLRIVFSDEPVEIEPFTVVGPREIADPLA